MSLRRRLEEYGLFARGLTRPAAALDTIELDPRVADGVRRRVADLGLPVQVFDGDALEVIAGLEHAYDLVFLDAQKDQYLPYLMALKWKGFRAGCLSGHGIHHIPLESAVFNVMVLGKGEYCLEGFLLCHGQVVIFPPLDQSPVILIHLHIPGIIDPCLR